MFSREMDGEVISTMCHYLDLDRDLSAAEMVEKEQYPKPQPNRVRELHNRKTTGRCARKLLIDLSKQLWNVHIVVKRHDRKSRPKKRQCRDKYGFCVTEHTPGRSFCRSFLCKSSRLSPECIAAFQGDQKKKLHSTADKSRRREKASFTIRTG